MAKTTVSQDFAFYTHLWEFYSQNKGRIRQHYRELTRKYLDYNHPDNANPFLRQPQYEALEMYIFLKEFLKNKAIHHIFDDWSNKKGQFENRRTARNESSQQLQLFEYVSQEEYQAVFRRMRKFARQYPSYIFALTMGTGKTILMATCIFYEFLLANKFPKDPLYCHNALVFAPDKTVLQSLREIETLDMGKVVPPAYVSFLSAHVQFHFLEEAGTSLSTIDNSRFNIIISNTQKIILKRQHKEKTATERLFASTTPDPEGDVYAQNRDLYGLDEPDDEQSLASNQRFEKLRRLQQLGVYVDEAHHAFGNKLARDMGVTKGKTSLRLTIDELAISLKRAGTTLVGCYNYTGTPYVGDQILPEVVYAFGLQDAIDKQYLKLVRTHGYTNPKTTEFVKFTLNEFLSEVNMEDRFDGLLPKIAFFASTVKELQEELRPAVEEALIAEGIPLDRILVNVGDTKITSNDDIREFNQLDTPQSKKQFILLVNKGREGWNCRSLFGVALYRKPRSKIFVLQATMRCLRAIGDSQPTGHVFLSQENKEILENELQENFRISIEEMEQVASDRKRYQIKVVPPPVKIKLKRIRRSFAVQEKVLKEKLDLQITEANTEQYRIIHTEQAGLAAEGNKAKLIKQEDITHLRESMAYSPIMLVGEIARYLNMSPLRIQRLLEESEDGLEAICKRVSQFNELLYDHVIPKMFHQLYDMEENNTTEEYEVDLIKVPAKGFYEISGREALTTRLENVPAEQAAKSFHLDTYCFDSEPERKLFWDLLKDGKVKKLYFTGMLTHGQSDFYVQYIDPESHTVRSYYPDFLLEKEDGKYVIVEVKGDNMVDDPVVRAKKAFAEQTAVASGMTYEMIKGSDAKNGNYQFLLGGPRVVQGTVGVS